MNTKEGGVTKTEGHVCVGGPLDGKVMTAQAQGFAVPVPNRFAGPTAINQVRYVRQEFHTSSRDFYVWCPEHQSFADTMALLLEGYAKFHPVNQKSATPR